MTLALPFMQPSREIEPNEGPALDRSLGQWMTPAWAAEAIVQERFGRLTADDLVIEPSCGTGRFLDALPAGTTAVGVEIDPRLAAVARRAGHTVVEGDFRHVPMPHEGYTAAIGNPPFDLAVFEGMLARMHGLLVENAPFVAILPSYMFQTSTRVMRWSERWSLEQTMIPRTIFKGISLPLVLATFTKNARRRLVGFALYAQSREIEEMPDRYASRLRAERRGWRTVVREAIEALGGSGTVDQIYREVGPRRPTGTDHWKAQVRKQLQQNFTKIGAARYAL